MTREKTIEVRVGDRYAVISEGMNNSGEIIKIDKIDFDDKCYANSTVHFKTAQKVHGRTEQNCRMWWIQDNCLLISEELKVE